MRRKLLGIDLSEKVAIVTGGSRGVGRACVELFAAAGARVAINYAENKEAARAAADAASAKGGQAIYVRGDVRDIGQMQALVRETLEAFGRIDILVCNAGVWRGAPVEELTEELWDEVIDINLKGTWTVCKAAVPELKKSGGGQIVIVSSTAGQRGEAEVSNYAASKGGQLSFTKSLAVELAPHNITVNAVAPGWIDTEMNREVFADAKRREQIESGIPLRRVATAEDVALPVLFLASAWARHITGEVLNVNGGAVLCG